MSATTIGIAGKGGAGKTTVAANVARLLGRSGRRVVAVDADSDPDLALATGLSAGQAARMRPLFDQSDGARRLPDDPTPRRLVRDYGTDAPDGVTLLLAARAERAGSG